MVSRTYAWHGRCCTRLMHLLQHIETTLLADVTGGVARMTRKVNDPTVLNAVTQLKSDLDSLVTAKNNQSGSSMSSMLPMMMMMNRG